MRCTFCQLDLSAEDLEPGQQVAKCRGCHQVFAIHLPDKTTASQPEKVIFLYEDGKGYMQWPWFHPMAYLLLMAGIVWVVYVLHWYYSVLIEAPVNNAQPVPTHWSSLLLPLIPLAVGLVLTYYAICLFINSTQVLYDGRLVTVRFGPLPLRPSHSYARTSIRRLCSEARLGRGYQPIGYRLMMVTGYESRQSLIGIESDPEVVRFVQQQLELWLQLPAGQYIK
ncbi:MAG: hypothetical protein QM703_25335 [Gemmatales bacterium]